MLKKLTLIISLCIATVCAAKAPRVTLEHFERDLQSMTKTTQTPRLKQGSFVHRLAEKKEQKEDIEHSMNTVKLEIETCSAELAQREQELAEINHKIRVCYESIEKQSLEIALMPIPDHLVAPRTE